MTNKRYSIFPLENPDLFDRYKKMESSLWKAQEVDFTNDEFDKLEESQKRYLKMLIFFFANSDSVVADNLALNFLQEDIPEEAKFFYGLQLYNENIHNETYALIIENYIKDLQEKEDAFNSILTQPVVAKKMKWALQWVTNGTFEEKIVAFSAIELILFASTFAGIFAFKNMGKNLEGLYVANEWISADELKHGEFATYFYDKFVTDKLSKEKVKEIILGAFEIEKQYVLDCFGDGVKGISLDRMLQYIQYVTDVVLGYYNIEPYFKVKQPFGFMDTLALPKRDNFFEKRVTEYKTIINDGTNIDEDLEF